MARHEAKKFKVSKVDGMFQVVITATGRRVPGTPTYESRELAQDHANQLNKDR